MEMLGLVLFHFLKAEKQFILMERLFQSLNGMGISGNYSEIETGNEYWISGVKKICLTDTSLEMEKYL